MEPLRAPGIVWLPVFLVAGAVVVSIGTFPAEELVISLALFGMNAALSPLVGAGAARKGRSFWAFFWISLFIGILIPALVVATMKGPEVAEIFSTKKCPKCAEQVKKEGQICRFCQHSFAPH